jgi:hypothetical protein
MHTFHLMNFKDRIAKLSEINNIHFYYNETLEKYFLNLSFKYFKFLFLVK